MFNVFLRSFKLVLWPRFINCNINSFNDFILIDDFTNSANEIKPIFTTRYLFHWNERDKFWKSN